jgi:hypothetical protein
MANSLSGRASVERIGTSCGIYVRAEARQRQNIKKTISNRYATTITSKKTIARVWSIVVNEMTAP